MTHPLKDARLDRLAGRGNVAQFVSFSPGSSPQVRYCRLAGEAPRGQEVATLLASAGSVNVRSFTEEREQGCPFHYGLRDVDAVLALVGSLAEAGFYTIVNETIDVHDGGFSGVSLGGVVEFAPDDTPRAVESAGTAALPFDLAVRLIEIVYGFTPQLSGDLDERLEFSIHPQRVGVQGSHTIWWETQAVPGTRLSTAIQWPNRFSRHVGDKAYGLLIAALLDLPVPRATVVGRRVAPFTFGTPTGTGEWWLRTCPNEQAPGLFTTLPMWADPFLLLSKEDPDAEHVVSVLSQESVNALWSGATIPGADGAPDLIEGVRGRGDAFMQGERAPEPLPGVVEADVRRLIGRARERLGPVRLEWVHDGTMAWIVQVHVATHFFEDARTLSPGEASAWLEYDAESGLEVLRSMLPLALSTAAGIFVRGNVGLTSHVGDLLRKAGVPAKLVHT